MQTSRYLADEFKRDIVILDRAKTTNETIYYNIDAIYKAIADRKEITFKYMEWSMHKRLVEKPKLYRVSPWLLVWNNENYYLVGYDDDLREKRHYRVDKMKKVNITEKACQNEKEFLELDKAAYGKATFGMYDGNRTSVKLRVDNELIGVMIDRFGTDIITVPWDDCSFCVQLEIDVSPKFYGWLAGLGTGIKILEPYMLAEDYRRYIQNIANIYR